MTEPLVSIIIPTYNRAHLIGETLDSVLAQTYQNWECIVVDDGSTDDTEAVMATFLARDSRFQYLHRPRNRMKGANACRNYGVEKSNGVYISFVDSDDLISNGFIKRRNEAFNRTNCDFVVANTGFFSSGKEQNNLLNKDPEFRTTGAYLFMFLAYQLPWTIMSVTWKREILEKHRFDENLQRLQDVDLHIRILTEPFVLYRLEEIDNYYRMDHQKNMDPNYINTVINNFQILFNKLMKEPYVVDYPQQLKRFGFYFLLNFILPNITKYKREFTEIYKLLSEINLLDRREKIILYMLEQLNYSAIGNKKGIGVYRINKYLKSLLLV
ncbi:glycosyltransferase family 2 protein [Aequorivita viscosa]|nr:glycosyltransferase family 2 protein [Aequorivita viscosa]